MHLIYWLSSAITGVEICNATLTVNVHGVETTATRRLDCSSTLLVFLIGVHLLVVVEYELLQVLEGLIQTRKRLQDLIDDTTVEVGEYAGKELSLLVMISWLGIWRPGCHHRLSLLSTLASHTLLLRLFVLKHYAIVCDID